MVVVSRRLLLAETSPCRPRPRAAVVVASRRPRVAVVEWTATATHATAFERGGLTVPATGKKISWNGMDIIPMRDGLVARKDVYADSMTFLKQLGVPLP